MGAGLLAKASCQLTSPSTDPPHSRASPLPQGFSGVRGLPAHRDMGLTSSAQATSQKKPRASLEGGAFCAASEA
ncbi:hypothetical protein C0J56_24440 [Pseudomonas fluorescens]|nr:hypothetical protein C0J56_24440 [Pseudomonas fluorescens]